jgi:hypothetical protein
LPRRRCDSDEPIELIHLDPAQVGALSGISSPWIDPAQAKSSSTWIS